MSSATLTRPLSDSRSQHGSAVTSLSLYGGERPPEFVFTLESLGTKKKSLATFLKSKGLIPKIVEARMMGGMRPLDEMLSPTLQDAFGASSREMQVNGSLMLHHSAVELLSQRELDQVLEYYGYPQTS